jgi:hypothetical protein
VLQHADAKAGAAVVVEGRGGKGASKFRPARGRLVGVSALPLRLRGRRLHHIILSGAIRFVRKGAFFNRYPR